MKRWNIRKIEDREDGITQKVLFKNDIRSRNLARRIVKQWNELSRYKEVEMVAYNEESHRYEKA